MKEERIKIIIGSDIAPTKSNEELFINGDIITLVSQEIMDLLKSCDYRVFNLELPLTNIDTPICKIGPNMKAFPDCVNGLKMLNADICVLANNHIFDYGPDGMLDTCSILDQNKIKYIGVGKNRDEAKQPYIINKNGLKVGIYACAEHEFSVQDYDVPGANPFDELETFDHILELKKQCDYIIVLYHGGKEYYRYPSPRLQRVFRKMVDTGADLVVAQHTHCVGCYEKYRNGYLVYGQGNFIFDGKDNEYWNSGILIEAIIDKNKLKPEFYAFQKKSNGTLRILDRENEVLTGFYLRSKEIEDPVFVRENYQKTAEKSLAYELRILNGENLIFRIWNKLWGGKGILKLYNKKARLAVLNHIECEAHRELIITALKESIKK